jgi:hypothetical protein
MSLSSLATLVDADESVMTENAPRINSFEIVRHSSIEIPGLANVFPAGVKMQNVINVF